MDSVRFGRGIRAIRHQRGWRQDDLAAAADVSRGVVWRIEHGRADRVPVSTLDRVAAALDARVIVRLDWRAEQLDRLLDGAHAELVDAVVAHLRAVGWDVVTEATFSVYGERGSIDVLAYHAPTRSLLVIEVKTVVPDIGPMLMTLDRKVRLASRIATEHGWQPQSISRLLVIREGPSVRRHVAKLAATFTNAFPQRNLEVRRWLRQPVGAMSGLWFLATPTRRRPTRRAVRPGAG